MASSRLQRLGTIYSRVTGLLRSGAMKVEDKPLWYDLYTAFPPEQEPSYSYKPPDSTINPIFYSEDKVRSKFHKSAGMTGMVNLSDPNPTACQEFISIYKRMAREKSEGNVYEEALDVLKTRHQQTSEAAAEASGNASLVSSFNEVKQRTETDSVGVNVKDIFKS